MCRTRIASAKAIGAWLCSDGCFSTGSTRSVGAGRRLVNRADELKKRSLTRRHRPEGDPSLGSSGQEFLKHQHGRVGQATSKAPEFKPAGEPLFAPREENDQHDNGQGREQDDCNHRFGYFRDHHPSFLMLLACSRPVSPEVT
jgi:hypothetical protein